MTSIIRKIIVTGAVLAAGVFIGSPAYADSPTSPATCLHLGDVVPDVTSLPSGVSYFMFDEHQEYNNYLAAMSDDLSVLLIDQKVLAGGASAVTDTTTFTANSADNAEQDPFIFFVPC